MKVFLVPKYGSEKIRHTCDLLIWYGTLSPLLYLKTFSCYCTCFHNAIHSSTCLPCFRLNSHGLNVIPRTEVNRSDRLLLIRVAETTLFHERRHGIGGLSRNNNVYGSVTKRLHDIGTSFWHSLYCTRFWYGNKSWCGRIDRSELKKIWSEKGSVSLLLLSAHIVNGC